MPSSEGPGPTAKISPSTSISTPSIAPAPTTSSATGPTALTGFGVTVKLTSCAGPAASVVAASVVASVVELLPVDKSPVTVRTPGSLPVVGTSPDVDVDDASVGDQPALYSVARVNGASRLQPRDSRASVRAARFPG